MEDCVTCRTVAGLVTPPGGIVESGEHWLFFLRSRPLLVAGQGFIVLRRHCEDVAQLTDAEAAALGPAMRRAAAALGEALAPERVHFGLYAEGVRHIHLHVLPRVRGLPRGNIPATALEQWYGLLARAGLRGPYPDEDVARVAARLREALAAAG